MRPNEPVAQYELGRLKNFVYLILDWQQRVAALVDSQRELSGPLEDLEKNGFKLARVLLTHTHHDHVAGIPELLKQFPEIPIHVHDRDAHRLSEFKENLCPVHDGEIMMLGATRIQVLHTPGHSAGESCYFLEGDPPYLLTGDTVFVRDCGRCDLPTGSVAEMFQSLQKIKRLPHETILLPGHHYTSECATTLEKELRDSPPFQARTVEELTAIP